MLSNFERSLRKQKANDSSIENSPIVIKSSKNSDQNSFEDNSEGSGFQEEKPQQQEPKTVNLKNAEFEVVKLRELVNPTETSLITTSTTTSTVSTPTLSTTTSSSNPPGTARIITKKRDGDENEVEPGKIVIIPANQNNKEEPSSIDNSVFNQVLQKLEKYGQDSLTEEELNILRQDIQLKHHRSDSGARDHSSTNNRGDDKLDQIQDDDLEIIEDGTAWENIENKVNFDDSKYVTETIDKLLIKPSPLTTTEVVAVVQKSEEGGETDQQRGPDGSWKENKCTMNTFEKCLNGGYCMPKVGNCLCKRGYTGERCELSACGPTHTLINGTCDGKFKK